MRKNWKNLLLALFIIIAITIIVIIGNRVIEPANRVLIKDREAIQNIIHKEYPLYQIKKLQPQYVDFFSTVTDADEDHKATRATVIIENSSEQRTIHLEKNLFGWRISSDKPDYGDNVPNDIYFIEISHESIGPDVNIDDHIIEKNYWIIPNENGDNYEKVEVDANWYYSLKHCSNIYKTKDGKVYVFNKEKLDWEEEVNINYSDLCYYGNYNEVDKNYAIEIIKKYSAYREE